MRATKVLDPKQQLARLCWLLTVQATTVERITDPATTLEDYQLYVAQLDETNQQIELCSGWASIALAPCDLDC